VPSICHKKSDVVKKNHPNADDIKEEYNGKKYFVTRSCFVEYVQYQSGKQA